MLALAEFYSSGLLPIKDIAARCDIPHQFLEQIFNRLGKAGIIKSTRGKNGGYQLAMPPQQITVLQIIAALEGDSGPLAVLDRGHMRTDFCLAQGGKPIFARCSSSLKRIIIFSHSALGS